MNLDTNNAQTQAVIDHARTLVAGHRRPPEGQIFHVIAEKHNKTHSLSYLAEIAEAVCKEQKEFFDKDYAERSTHKNRYFIYDSYGEDDDETEVSKAKYDEAEGKEQIEHHTVFTNGANQTCHTKIVE